MSFILINLIFARIMLKYFFRAVQQLALFCHMKMVMGSNPIWWVFLCSCCVGVLWIPATVQRLQAVGSLVIY